MRYALWYLLMAPMWPGFMLIWLACVVHQCWVREPQIPFMRFQRWFWYGEFLDGPARR